MNFQAVLAQLNDLPPAYLRTGTTFGQFQASIAYGLTSYTDSDDAIAPNYTAIETSYFGWLDTWGLLFGIVRNTNESDYLYRRRVQATLLAFVGTVPGIEIWGSLILGGSITVAEYTSGAGYTITVPPALNTSTLSQFVQSLSRIRPAGVPFTVVYTNGATFLDSVNYFDAPRVSGAYLNNSVTTVPFPTGASTLNSAPLLPSLFLTDPTLNPVLN